jgi:hypothetical protein
MSNNIFVLLLLFGVVSCRTGFNKQAYFNDYLSNWKGEVYAAIDSESYRIPEGCPILKDRIEQYKKFIAASNLYKNKEVIERFITLPPYLDSDIFLIDRYMQGFNFSHCTRFIFFKKNGEIISGYESCKRSPDPIMVENEPFVLDTITDANKTDIGYYLALISNCNSDGVSIVTLLDNNFNIKRVHVAIMPN